MVLDGIQPVAAGTETGTAVLRVDSHAALIELPGSRQIEETVTVGIIVTHKAPGTAQLQVTEPALEGLPPLFLRRDPTYGDGRKQAVAHKGDCEGEAWRYAPVLPGCRLPHRKGDEDPAGRCMRHVVPDYLWHPLEDCFQEMAVLCRP